MSGRGALTRPQAILLATRAAALAAGLWAGVIACIGAMAAPIAFATVASSEAGRIVGRLLAQEAYLGLALAAVLFAIERVRSGEAARAGAGSVFSVTLVLVLATLFCTVAGHFAVQPMLVAARLGQGAWSFGALHAISGGLFVLKGMLALLLSWRFGSAAQAAAPNATTAATTF
jgi:Domain of unknown function (DUF4149)